MDITRRTFSATAAAAYLGVTAKTLYRWRLRGCGPEFELTRLSVSGPMVAVYRERELREWKANGHRHGGPVVREPWRGQSSRDASWETWPDEDQYRKVMKRERKRPPAPDFE